MTAIKKDTTTSPLTRTCEFPGCDTHPRGKSARYCQRHRKLIKLRTRANMSTLSAEQLRALKAEMEETGEAPPTSPPPEATTRTVGASFYSAPVSRQVDAGEICPARAAYIDEILARRKAAKR